MTRRSGNRGGRPAAAKTGATTAAGTTAANVVKSSAPVAKGGVAKARRSSATRATSSSRSTTSRQKSGPTPRRRSAAPPTRSFRGRYVALGVGGALLTALCGFGIFQDSRRTCVERGTETIVDERECTRPGGTAAWYYGGRGGSIGDKATGGSFERGGFGRFFSGGG